MGCSRLQWVTTGYTMLQQVTVCMLQHVIMGYNRLRWVTRRYGWLQ